MQEIKEHATLFPFSQYERPESYVSAADQEKHPKKIRVFQKKIEDFILQEGYPCIAARTSINSKAFAFGIFDKMDCWRTDGELAHGLTRYLHEMATKPSNYLTYIAIFEFDGFQDEKQYETAMWSLLNRLALLSDKHFPWPEKVSDDPADTQFAYSFGGRAFYLVGMHPKSSRKARRFPYTAIAFNLHSQFEALRKKHRYGRIKQVIRKNDLRFSGSINPMLSDFGKGLEAPQYSGRAVSPQWECPFKKEIISS